MLSRTRWTARTVLAHAAICLVGAVLAVQTGCETTSNRSLNRNESFKPANEAYATLGYRHVWAGFPAMSPGAQITLVEILDDVICVQNSNAVLSVLETSGGTTRWSDQLGDSLTKFVGLARDNRNIVCSSETEAFFLDVDTGTLLNKQRFNRVANTSPEIVNDLLVYGTARGQVFGDVQVQGFRAWGATLDSAIEIDPVRMGDMLCFVSRNGEVAFLNGATGSSFSRSKMFMGTQVPMGMSKDLVFIASTDQSVYAFSPSAAAPVWRHRTNVSLDYPPVYHMGVVYCAVGGDGLTAFGEYGVGGRGDVKWVSKGVFGEVIGVRNGRLLVWDGRDMCLVDPSNGDLIERVRLAGVTKVVTDTFVDGNLYLATTEGVIAKLSPRQ